MPSIHDEVNQPRELEAPHARAFVNLFYTHTWLTGKLRSLLDDFDITYQQYNVLRILQDSHPKPLCGMEIKDLMLDKNPDVTRLCDRLESKGYLTRKNNQQNRRQVHVAITPEGLALLAQIEPGMRTRTDELSGLTENEAGQLSSLLDKMRDGIEARVSDSDSKQAQPHAPARGKDGHASSSHGGMMTAAR